jgi:hypothetical protein
MGKEQARHMRCGLLRRATSYSDWRAPGTLRLLKHHERVGAHSIALHRLSSLAAVHRFLELAEVRDLEEQSDPI